MKIPTTRDKGGAGHVEQTPGQPVDRLAHDKSPHQPNLMKTLAGEEKICRSADVRNQEGSHRFPQEFLKTIRAHPSNPLDWS